ncbi:MAG: tetratricopeptide repeat protein [Cyanobacteria bacterium HKST-UBA02]|nr:tetratricopeptide repeat protein [Cyanobacteria bacterium HKST-UBA02]
MTTLELRSRIWIILVACFLSVQVLAGCSLDPESKIKEAELLTVRGEWQKAIAVYSNVLAAYPRDPVCLARRGYLYGHEGQFKKAFADFDAAIESDAKCPEPYIERSSVYCILGFEKLSKRDAEKALSLIPAEPVDAAQLLQYASTLFNAGKRDKAAKAAQKALALCSKRKDLNSLILAANALCGFRQYKEALANLDEAWKLAPDCAYVRFLRGRVYCSQERWSQAIDELERYARLSRANPIVLGVLGDCNHYNGDFDKAISYFDQAIDLVPDYANGYYKRGQVYHDIEKHRDAIEDFSTAIKLRPDDAHGFVQRADNYCHLKEWKNALKDAHQALSLDPESAQAYRMRACAQGGLGNFDEAVESYGRAISLSPEDATIYCSRGMLYREHKDYKNAIADLTEAIKLDSKNAIYYCARGSALVSDHQYERAIADCSESLKLNSSRTHPHLSRGIAYSRLGKYSLALEDLDEAIRQYPEYGEAFYERSLIYKALGKQTESQEDMVQAKKFGYEAPEVMI